MLPPAPATEFQDYILTTAHQPGRRARCHLPQSGSRPTACERKSNTRKGSSARATCDGSLLGKRMGVSCVLSVLARMKQMARARAHRVVRAEAI